MNGFNLSEWALRHRSFVWYLMLAIVLAGGLSYTRLGREEDPSFTIKTMIVYASWPGATVEEMTNQVTDRIERKLQELDTLDFTKSYTTPGQTTVFVNLKDDTPGRDIRGIWVQVRNKVNDIRGDFPASVQGPFFNDQFGDVFGNIYALTADGLSFRQLRDYAEQARAQILKMPSAGRVELLGVQDEVIYLNFSTRQIAGLGVDQQAVLTQPAAAERRGAVGHRAGRPRDGEPAGERPVHLGREPARRQPPGQRPLLPADRHRHHHARLCRPAAADVPLQRPAGDRHRHRHEGQRQPHPVRQGPAGAHDARWSPTCRSASACIWSRTSRRSSRRRSAASRGRCSRPWRSCWS